MDVASVNAKLRKLTSQMDDSIGELCFQTKVLKDINSLLLSLTIDMEEAELKGEVMYWHQRTDHISRVRTLSSLMTYVMQEVAPVHEQIQHLNRKAYAIVRNWDAKQAVIK